MDQSVMLWWIGMSSIAIFNICLLIYSYRLLQKKMPNMSADMTQWRKKHFLLASIYTLGCGFRSIFPREDLTRTVLFDSGISAIVIGRSVATIAELSFVAQWCLLLYEIGKNTGNKTILKLSKIPFPLIVIAEIFSWYACTTTNSMGTVFEESLWAIAAGVTVYGLYLARPYYQKAQRKLLNAGILAGCVYVLYMVLVDVPNYISNWMTDQAANKVYPSLKEGFIELCTLWHQTYAHEDWAYAMIWMTLYFSVAVWMSIALINVPEMDKNIKTLKR